MSMQHFKPMLATLTIDDDVMLSATRTAAARALPVDQLISDLLRSALMPADPTIVTREDNGFPIFRVPAHTPPILTEAVLSALDTDE